MYRDSTNKQNKQLTERKTNKTKQKQTKIKPKGDETKQNGNKNKTPSRLVMVA